MMSLSCDRIQDLLPEYAAGTLDGARRAQLEAHLATCTECRAEGDVVARVLTAVPAVPGDLEARVLRTLRTRPVTAARWGTPRQYALVAALAVALIGAPWVYEQVAPRSEPAEQTSPVTMYADDPVSGTTLSDLTEEELEALLARLES